jgi:hypothetical protein
MDIDLFSTNLLDKMKIMVLLMRTKIGHLGNILWGYIWVAGRFSKRHMRCIREEDNKSNKQVIAKLLVQISLLVLY